MITDKKNLATKAMMESGFDAIVKTKKGRTVPAFVRGGLARITQGRVGTWQDAELVRVLANDGRGE